MHSFSKRNIKVLILLCSNVKHFNDLIIAVWAAHAEAEENKKPINWKLINSTEHILYKIIQILIQNKNITTSICTKSRTDELEVTSLKLRNTANKPK